MSNHIRNVCLVVLLIAIVAFGVLSSARRAHADPTPPRDGTYVSVIMRKVGSPIWTVTLSDGYKAAIRPCRVEDGRRCYWIGPQRGHHSALSFLVLKGQRFYLDPHML